MSYTSSTSDLSARVKTGFPLAAGIAILLFTPVFVIGLAVLVVAFIGAQELTAEVIEILSALENMKFGVS